MSTDKTTVVFHPENYQARSDDPVCLDSYRVRVTDKAYIVTEKLEVNGRYAYSGFRKEGHCCRGYYTSAYAWPYAALAVVRASLVYDLDKAEDLVIKLKAKLVQLEALERKYPRPRK